MGRIEGDGLGVEGRLFGTTTFVRNGKKYIRVAHSRQPKRLTPKQLVLREQLAHNNALWRALSQLEEVFFEGGTGPYYRFMSVNNASPVPFLTKGSHGYEITLLLPNMAVSDGPLSPVGYRLGEVKGQPALLTNLSRKEARKGKVLLYVLQQKVLQLNSGKEIVQLDIKAENVNPSEFATINGSLALKGGRFADPMLGFALVRVVDGHASSQRVVTHCKFYEKFTTEEAFQAAAQSYGGLKY